MEKSTGIIRNVDELGRIVLPVELRRNLHIEIGTPIEIFTEGKKVILRKYETKLCENCGQNVDEQDKFCRNCGKEAKANE